MKFRKEAIILTALITLSIAGLSISIKKYISPYRTFEEARNSAGSVQIIGIPDRNKPAILETKGCYIFTVKDYYLHSSQFNILYCKTLSQNIHHSEQIVAKGRFNAKTGYFVADALYFKCPSKYSTTTYE